MHRALAGTAALGLAAMWMASASAQQTPPTNPPQVREDQFAKLPYWPGFWVSEGQAGTTIGGIAPDTLAAREGRPTSGVPMMSLAGMGAPWSEEGRRRQAEVNRTRAGRKAMGWGYPLMMNSAAPLQFLITPEETLIVSPYGDTRHIYTDGRPMPPLEDLWPTVWGTSVGRWEGHVLVVETVQVKNPNIYFHGAPPLSEEARYHERIYLEGDRLVDEITIEDPVTLTGPWKTRLTFVRDQGFDRMVHIDFENDRSSATTIEPAAGGGQ
ncbi:MAG: hypothetical protein B7Z08_01925 [Sphingomonadales bacterium 32-68-7]|nr:MAG: hypothetical protein B7Z33_10630 [Sphingomonadales bacterium 12-68-11]OYX10137.1 MAG: hypothetical protein B7Z08_01925 [Sphingomonadales bacterium 32-68-7]